VVENNIHGDVLETGCFRGGASVLMHASLDVYESVVSTQNDRKMLVADSFEGIPLPRTARGEAIDDTAAWPEELRYAATMDSVRDVFHRYGRNDDRLVMIKGFFNESLPAAVEKQTIQRLSLVHIDADSYESVLDVLHAVYHLVSAGGYVVVDDIALVGVRAAINEFRAERNISAPLLPVPADFVLTCSIDYEDSRLWASDNVAMRRLTQ